MHVYLKRQKVDAIGRRQQLEPRQVLVIALVHCCRRYCGSLFSAVPLLVQL